jgi:L-seryl-tRNA(Ser) seleniumtransferase
MLAAAAEAIETRVRALIAAVGPSSRFDMEVRDGFSMVGGGSAPGIPIPTRLLALHPKGCDAAALESALRECQPPMIARVEQELVLLDLRTVQPDEDEAVIESLRALGRSAK